MLEEEKNKIDGGDDNNPNIIDNDFDILFELMQEKSRHIQKSLEILKKINSRSNKI